jgi:hypothetical protein
MRFEDSGNALQHPPRNNCLGYWRLKQKKLNSKFYAIFSNPPRFLLMFKYSPKHHDLRRRQYVYFSKDKKICVTYHHFRI